MALDAGFSEEAVAFMLDLNDPSPEAGDDDEDLASDGEERSLCMPPEPFLHISYGSSLVDDSEAIIAGIVGQAAENNRQIGITGCIAFDGHRCVQIIEGSVETVEALFSRIRRDERHTGVVELVRTSVEKLHFSDWGMVRWPITDLYILSENITTD